MVRLKPTLSRALALFFAVFALYALTAQRGLGWGDSGEFQYRVLTLGADGILRGGDSFATAHPLYVAVAKAFCSTPYQVTLVSSFFGALAVALFFLLSRNLMLAFLLALAHGLWWLSTVSEVYTMSLAFFAAELLALKRFRETGGVGALFALAALNGLHLEVHNFALLALPVYAWVVLCRRDAPVASCRRGVPAASDGEDIFPSDATRTSRLQARTLLFAALVWTLAASFWLWAFFTLGPREVLVGSYGAQVIAHKPVMPLAIPFNLALGALTLAVPALLAVWGWAKGVRRETRDVEFWRPLTFLFGIHVLFWSTYFVVSQYTFILPSAFLAYLLVAHIRVPRGVWALLAVAQLILPVAAWGVLSCVGFPSDYRALHPGRDDAAYFALPWHVQDHSADSWAAHQRQPWKGYPRLHVYP